MQVGVALVLGGSTWRSSRWLPSVSTVQIGCAVVSGSVGSRRERTHSASWTPSPVRVPANLAYSSADHVSTLRQSRPGP